MTEKAETIFGGWLIAAAYSWVLRVPFGVDMSSAWHWVPIVAFLGVLFIGVCAEGEQVPGTEIKS
jgi:hypothetical protein